MPALVCNFLLQTCALAPSDIGIFKPLLHKARQKVIRPFLNSPEHKASETNLAKGLLDTAYDLCVQRNTITQGKECEQECHFFI